MNLNKELYEKVLKHRFPKDYFWGIGGICLDDNKTFKPGEAYVSVLRPTKCLNDAFYFAEKLGLFKNHYLNRPDDLWLVMEVNDENGVGYLDLTDISEGATPQEAIVRALIAVYGKEE